MKYQHYEVTFVDGSTKTFNAPECIDLITINGLYIFKDANSKGGEFVAAFSQDKVMSIVGVEKKVDKKEASSCIGFDPSSSSLPYWSAKISDITAPNVRFFNTDALGRLAIDLMAMREKVAHHQV